MRIVTILAIVALSHAPGAVEACSCFGPSTFCETLNPPYEPPIDPAWWIPDNIVIGVKIATVDYGVDLRIVQSFTGGLEIGEVVRVWGDCGLLCRMYNTDVADGDTVLWALRHCDLSGNGSCGTSLEQASHYQLSVCGVYWLNYSNGIISGPLFTEGATETVGVEDFAALIASCLSTGVKEPISPDASVQCVDGRLTITTTGAWADIKDVLITDAAGHTLYSARFVGKVTTVVLPRRMNGLMLVRMTDGSRTQVHKVMYD